MEKMITSILNARKRQFEDIMARLHFQQIKRGATKNFAKWVTQRFATLKDVVSDIGGEIEADEEEHYENLIEKIKTMAQYTL